MRRLALIFLFAVSFAALASAQTSLSFGTPVKGELSVSVPINLLGTDTTALTALQFSMVAPSANVTMTIAAGLALTNAGKATSCAVNTSGKEMCIAWGMNQTLIKDGVIATVTITAPTAQDVQQALADLLGASTDGSGLTITTTTPTATFSLRSKCDLNNDMKVDIVDVAGALGQAQGMTACTTADVTGRGKCDILDIQKIVNAGVTGICK